MFRRCLLFPASELSGLSKELSIQLVNSRPEAGEGSCPPVTSFPGSSRVTKPVSSSAGFLLGQVSVTFDLLKKQPSGQQTFPLVSRDGASGSLTTEVRPRPHPRLTHVHASCQMSGLYTPVPPQFTYLEPSEVRSWHPPTPAYSKRVEMDRTVMPCGTVVTTVTAVKSKPGRLPPPPGPGSGREPQKKSARVHGPGRRALWYSCT